MTVTVVDSIRTHLDTRILLPTYRLPPYLIPIPPRPITVSHSSSTSFPPPHGIHSYTLHTYIPPPPEVHSYTHSYSLTQLQELYDLRKKRMSQNLNLSLRNNSNNNVDETVVNQDIGETQNGLTIETIQNKTTDSVVTTSLTTSEENTENFRILMDIYKRQQIQFQYQVRDLYIYYDELSKS